MSGMEGNGTRALRPYVAILAVLLVLRLVLPGIRLAPGPWVYGLNLLLTVGFVALPILALFRAAAFPWTSRTAGWFLGVGIAAHAGGVVLARLAGPGPAGLALEAMAQTGLMVWTVGLGAFLALLIRDRNLLLPVALFLAGFDAFLILTPTSLPQQVMQRAPEVFQSVAVRVPGVGVSALAYVGPADLFFLAMFFIALHRFQMRVRETFRWVVPVLVAYLLVVIGLGSTSVAGIPLGALPALVPIGLTVLLVNRKEFRMTRDELIATWVVGLLALALAGYGYSRRLVAPPESVNPSPASLAVPVTPGPGPAPGAPGATPAPVPAG